MGLIERNNFFKEFLLILWKQSEEIIIRKGYKSPRACFELGGNIYKIVEKLYKNGYDLSLNPELEKIFIYRNWRDVTVKLIDFEEMKQNIN